ncbi:MAG: Serine protease, subtilase family, partial [uncultured Chloroflexia bacterium]
ASAAAESARYVPGEVLIQYRDGTTAAQQSRARGKVGTTKVERIKAAAGKSGRLELARIGAGRSIEAAVRTLKSDPAVAFAEPNWIYTHGATATDPYYKDGLLWGVYGDSSSPANQFGSQAAEAWTAGNTGKDTVYVGIIDEGIQYNHPDLDTNVWTNLFDPADGTDNDGNGYVDDVRGWDFANGDSTIYDGGTRGGADDHGTHVSGTIGAEANGTGVVGVNWDVTLISGKFLGRNGGTTANAIKAVDYFTDLKTRHGLNIVATNNSWGGGGYSQGLFDAIQRANNANILFIAAAGNGDRKGNGINNDSSPHYPSSYTNANIISVAAIDNVGSKTTWWNYGVTSVDLGAPGAGIWSTTAYNKYESYNGTSMATPHVTGAAALYASVKPDANAAAIKNAILSSALPTLSMSGKTTTGGRLDANGALSR